MRSALVNAMDKLQNSPLFLGESLKIVGNLNSPLHTLTDLSRNFKKSCLKIEIM